MTLRNDTRPSSGVVAAAAALAAGRSVLLLDDLNAPYRSELVFAAEHADAGLVAHAVRHTSGFLTVALTDADADRLGLPPMWRWSARPTQPDFTVTADAKDGVTTGISAADRARTIRVMGSAAGAADQLRRPGHVVGVRTAAPGTFRQLRTCEAALALLRIAGTHPAAALATVVEDRGGLSCPAAARDMANENGLPVVTVTDVAAHRPACRRPGPQQDEFTDEPDLEDGSMNHDKGVRGRREGTLSARGHDGPARPRAARLPGQDV